jgi:hypothetical protein
VSIAAPAVAITLATMFPPPIVSMFHASSRMPMADDTASGPEN